MKCPKCNEEIEDGVKFCTKCGANIDEEMARIADDEEKKRLEAEKRKKELEDKKRLEEIRKEEERKREEAIKEAEKEEAIRKAKEEGIELEIIDKKPEEKQEIKEEKSKNDFKVKKETKPKKKKVRIKKNIFQIILGKLIFLIIVSAIVIGGVYYCYKNNILPDWASEKVGTFEHTVQNVIQLHKDVEEGKKNLPEVEESKENWKLEPSIEATDIRDLNEDVSVIVKDKKEGLIDNNTGEIVLEPKYTLILISDYYDIDKTENEKENGIVVKDIEKNYKLTKDYEIGTEVNLITKPSSGTYYFDHHGPYLYFNNSENICTALQADSTAKGLKVCTDIDIITTDGLAAKDVDLPDEFTIDFKKSKILTKGYVDLSTAELKINCDYDEAYEFSEGFAAVTKDGKAGIIDEDGKEKLEIKYQAARSVHGNLAFVKKDGKWGIMNID